MTRSCRSRCAAHTTTAPTCFLGSSTAGTGPSSSANAGLGATASTTCTGAEPLMRTSAGAPDFQASSPMACQQLDCKVRLQGVPLQGPQEYSTSCINASSQPPTHLGQRLGRLVAQEERQPHRGARQLRLDAHLQTVTAV